MSISNTDPSLLPASILEELPLAVVKLDRNYQVIYSNSAILGVLGTSSEAALGKIFFELIPEFERVKIEFLYKNLNFISSSYSNSHYREDFSSLITHKIFPHQDGITVLLEKEVFRYTPSADRKESRFKELLDELPGGIIVVDAHSSKVVYSNRVIQEWMEYSSEEMGNLTTMNLFPKEDLEFVSKGFSRIHPVKKNMISGVHISAKRKNRIPVEMTIVQVEWNNRPCYCAFFIDVREKEESAKIHAEWEKYREILGQLAIKFINIPSEKLTVAVEEALAIAAKLSNSDRAFALRFDSEAGLAHTDYTWLDPSLPSYREKLTLLPLGLLSHVWNKLKSDGILEYDDIDQLDDTNPLKNVLNILKIQSLVMLPIMEGTEFYGVVGFGKVKTKKNFSESELVPVQMASEIISNALLRQKTENLLIESEQENQKLFENSPVGLLYQNVEGRVLKANKAALQLMGLIPEEVSGWSVLNPDWKAFSETGTEIHEFNLPAKECLESGSPITDHIISIYRPTYKDKVWISVDVLPEFQAGDQKPFRVFSTFKDITEQKNYLNAVIKAEKRYRSLVENLPGAVYSCKLDGKLTPIHMTDKVEKITGYSGEDFISNRIQILDLIHPGDIQKFREQVDKAIHEHGTFQVTYRINTYNSGIRWVEDMGEVVMLDEGQSFLIGFWHDITERIEAEQTLEKNLKLLEAIVENSHSAIFVKDLDYRYIMVNRRWEMVTGHGREEVLKKRLEEFARVDVSNKYLEEDKKVLIEGKSFFSEEKIEQHETELGITNTQFFLSVKFPYRNNKGEIIGMCGISTDITAVKEASMMVQEREANLQGILESVNESIWSLDKDLNILFTNQTFFNEFYQAFGIELMKGINIIKSITVAQEREKWIKRYQRVLHLGQPLQFSDCVNTPEKTYHLDVVLYPIIVNGIVEGISGFSKDVTEKMALEESSKLYLNLFESATNEIYLISTRSLTIQQSNQAAQINTGYSKNELAGLSILNLIQEKDQEFLLEKAGGITAEKLVSAFLELNWLRKDGTTYPTEVLLQLFHYEGEDYLSAFVTDISERKRSQLALQESELRFSQIFQENVTPMLLIDPNTGSIVDANSSASSYYGYEINDLKSKNLLDVNHTFVSNPEEMEAATRQVLSSGKGKFLFNHKLKSGELRSVEVFCSKIRVDSRDLVHEIIQDVTDRNNFYNAVVKQNETLREIAWIQSHIVRAPLAKIMGLVQLLQDGKDDEDEYTDDFVLNAILNAANELDKVILDISEKSNSAKHLLE
jgi:PAS domain S-box-containing protein